MHEQCNLLPFCKLQRSFYLQREGLPYLACNEKNTFFTFEHQNRYKLWSCQNMFDALTYLLDNIFIRFGTTSRKENPQKLTQLSSRSHPRHLVGKGTAQKDTIIDITSDSKENSNFPYRWSPASLTFNNYFYLFLYLYINE